MRSHKERVAVVEHRIGETERKKRQRRSCMFITSSIAASFFIIVGLSALLPMFVEKIRIDEYIGFETAASIFGNGEMIGYIVMGFISFLLGVCVTILCFHFGRHHREDKKEERDADD